MSGGQNVVALAGGVGAARFLRGLVATIGPERITAVVNTADDLELHGLHVSPDLDTVTYTLAGSVHPGQGWGLDGESWAVMAALERFAAVRPAGSDAALTWFRLGDRDLATHLYRTRRLEEGAPLSAVVAELARAWGLGVRLLPMTDERVRTRLSVTGAEGPDIGFQDYFVRLRHDVDVSAVRFEGAGAARPAPGVIEAIEAADVVVVCPSNPIVSIGPILAVPGIADCLAARRPAVVAVSPIVGGAALRGPADRLMAGLGVAPSVEGVARLYARVASALVIDPVDAALAGAVEGAGMRPVVAPSVMYGLTEATALAAATLAAVTAPAA